MNPLPVELKLLDPRWGQQWPLPAPATAGAAAVDLRAAISEPWEITPAARLVPTGLAIHIGTPGVAALILPRSGLGHKQGLVLGNGTGLIDSDYQGELMVSLVSRLPESHASVWIEPGDRVAQLMFVPVVVPGFSVVESFGTHSERGAAGFGHTGKS